MGKFTFNGVTIVAPGFILRSTIGVQRVLQLLPFGKIMMMGASDGGIGDGTIYEFNDTNTMQAVLRSGPLYDYLAAAARVGGASGFVAVVTGTKTPSTYTMIGASTIAGIFTSGDQGIWNDSITLQAVTGTTSGFQFIMTYPLPSGQLQIIGGPGTAYDNLTDLNALNAVLLADNIVTPPAATGFQPIVTLNVTNNGAPTVMGSPANMTGGTGSGAQTLTFSDYKVSIDATVDEPYDIGHAVFAYDSPTQAYADAQNDEVSKLGLLRRWIHQVAESGTSPTNSKQVNSTAIVNGIVGRATALLEPRASVVGQQFQTLDPVTGAPVYLDAAPIMCGYLALVGATGANGPATAMTQDIIPTVSLVDYTVLKQTGDQDRAILGGGMVFEQLNSGVRCVQSVTTAPNDSNGNPWIYAEISVQRVVDAVIANIKAAIEGANPKAIGGGNDARTQAYILSIVRDVLEDALAAGWITGFNPAAISISPVPNSPTDDIVTWDMTPVFPLNHLGLDQTVQPFSVTVSQQAAAA